MDVAIGEQLKRESKLIEALTGYGRVSGLPDELGTLREKYGLSQVVNLS